MTPDEQAGADIEIQKMMKDFDSLGALVVHCVTKKIEVQNGLGRYAGIDKVWREALDRKYSNIITRLAEIMYPPK